MTSLAILTISLAFSACEEEDYIIKPLERCAYSAQFNLCACSLYDLMKMERVGEGYEKPAEYCDDYIGFKKEDWALEIAPKGKVLMKFAERYLNGQCRGKK